MTEQEFQRASDFIKSAKEPCIVIHPNYKSKITIPEQLEVLWSNWMELDKFVLIDKSELPHLKCQP